MEHKHNRVAPLAMARFGGKGDAGASLRSRRSARICHPGTYELASIGEPVSLVGPPGRRREARTGSARSVRQGGDATAFQPGKVGTRTALHRDWTLSKSRKPKKSSSPGWSWQDAPTVSPPSPADAFARPESVSPRTGDSLPCPLCLSFFVMPAKASSSCQRRLASILARHGPQPSPG
jgi:hypothetical protein